MLSQRGSENHFDVIILGSGFAGAALASILARHGRNVLLVDSAVHPRFAVGESTTPPTLVACRLLATRYDVPELETVVSFDKALAEIGPVFGAKDHFGFMIHREGEEPNLHETTGVGTDLSHLRTGHLFRQDSDAYLFHTAIKYGCTVRQLFRVTDVDVQDDFVEIVGTSGERYTARYLVDAGGFRSPLATYFGLRENPCTLKHHSRSLFTHMIGVLPTDECLPVDPADRPPTPWVRGTMHHLIDRGWFWIIPFNNHERSTNPLVSVGLTIDERRYPKPSDMSPEEEFRHQLGRFPMLERIFADARTVRPWVSTDRLQYTSTRTVGSRWCLLSHAAGFIDPLYSRGLTNTAEVINALAWRLLAALDDDDFSEERFSYVEQLQQGLVRYNDELVNCAFISWSDFDLWNAVFRVWAGAQYPDSLVVNKFLAEYRKTGDDAAFRAAEQEKHPGLPFRGSDDYKNLFEEMVRLCEAVDRGERDTGSAGAELMDRVVASPAIIRHLGFEDPSVHFIWPTAESLAVAVKWLATDGPESMRHLASISRFAPDRATRP